MPTYEYFCEKCQKEFEEFHSISTKLDECPFCKDNSNPPKRLISGSSFILSSGGVGWSKDSYSK